MRISKSDWSYLALDLVWSVSRRVGLGRVVSNYHRTRRRLSHPQPFTHAKTTIVSQHGCHLHLPWPSFLAAKGETHVGKHKKQEKKTRRTTLFLTVKKTTKTTFFCSLKWGLSRTRKTQKTKMTPFPKDVFSVFCFQEQKTILENSIQTCPKSFCKRIEGKTCSLLVQNKPRNLGVF